MGWDGVGFCKWALIVERGVVRRKHTCKKKIPRQLQASKSLEAQSSSHPLHSFSSQENHLHTIREFGIFTPLETLFPSS